MGMIWNGKQLRKHIAWTPEKNMTKKQIEKELERQAVLFEERCKSGQYLDGSIKFSDFIDQWLSDYAEKQLKAKTLARYKELIGRIVPALGHIRLDRLQPHHLLQFYDNLAEDKIRNDRSFQAAIDINALIKRKMLIKDFLTACDISNATLHVACSGKNANEKTAN